MLSMTFFLLWMHRLFPLVLCVIIFPLTKSCLSLSYHLRSAIYWFPKYRLHALPVCSHSIPVLFWALYFLKLSIYLYFSNNLFISLYGLLTTYWLKFKNHYFDIFHHKLIGTSRSITIYVNKAIWSSLLV